MTKARHDRRLVPRPAPIGICHECFGHLRQSGGRDVGGVFHSGNRSWFCGCSIDWWLIKDAPEEAGFSGLRHRRRVVRPDARRAFNDGSAEERFSPARLMLLIACDRIDVGNFPQRHHARGILPFSRRGEAAGRGIFFLKHWGLLICVSSASSAALLGGWVSDQICINRGAARRRRCCARSFS
jgi:hypothetical protein